MTIVEAPPTMRYPLARVTYEMDEINAVTQTLIKGQTTCGKRVCDFEGMFAEYVGRKHAIMVNSGSSADLLVALSLGPPQTGRGNEVLVPAVTWPTQVSSCLIAGYTVRLVDVDPVTLQMDPNDLATKVSLKVRALFLVHVLGMVGDPDALAAACEPFPIDVIEDSCEALGSFWKGKHVGTFGSAAAFSFFFSHLINTMEGGMVVCDDDKLARSYRLWRSHGWEPKEDYRFWFPSWGLNVRPTEVQGAFGCVQMARLDAFRSARQRNYDRLAQALDSEFLHTPVVSADCSPGWHGFPLMVDATAPFGRDQICRYLDSHGVETRPIIAGNIARQPVVQNAARVIAGPLPGADAIHTRGFYIGLASHDDEAGTSYVAEVVSDFLRTVC